MSPADPDQVPQSPDMPLANPLTSAMVVIYATLILLALAVPRGLVNWARDWEPGPVQRTVLAVAEEIQRFSRSTGLEKPYAFARLLFLELNNKNDE